MSKKKFTGLTFNSFDGLDPTAYALKEAERLEEASQETEPATAGNKKTQLLRKSGNTSIDFQKSSRKPGKNFDPSNIDIDNPVDLEIMEKWHPETQLTKSDQGKKMQEYAEGLRRKYKVSEETEHPPVKERDKLAAQKYKEDRREERLKNRETQDNIATVEPEEEPLNDENEDTKVQNEDETNTQKRNTKGYKPFDLEKAKLSRRDETVIENARNYGPIPLDRLQQRLDDALDETNLQERRISLLELLVAIQNGVTPPGKKNKDKPLSEKDSQVVQEISKEIQSLLSEAEESMGEKKKSKSIDAVLKRLREARGQADNEGSDDKTKSIDDQPEKNRQAKSPEGVRLGVTREILSGKLSSTEFTSLTQAMNEPGFIAFCNKVSEQKGWDYETEIEEGDISRVKEEFETFVKARELVLALKDTYKGDIEKKTDGILQLPADAEECIDLYVIGLATDHGSLSNVTDILRKCLVYKHGPALIREHEQRLLEADKEYNSQAIKDHFDLNEERVKSFHHLQELLSTKRVVRKVPGTTIEQKRVLSEKFKDDPRLSTNIVGRITGAVKRFWKPEKYITEVSETLSTDRVQLENAFEEVVRVESLDDDETRKAISNIKDYILELGYDKKGYLNMSIFNQNSVESNPKGVLRNIKTNLTASIEKITNSVAEISKTLATNEIEADVPNYSRKEVVRLAQNFAKKSKDTLGNMALDPKEIVNNPESWINSALDRLNEGIVNSNRIIETTGEKLDDARKSFEAVREQFSLAKTRIFEEVANGADVRDAVIKHALEKIKGKGKKPSAATLQARRDIVTKIDAFIAKTGQQGKALDLQTFNEDELKELAAEIERERIDLLIEETNKTLDKVKIGTVKFDALRKTLLATIESVKDKNGQIIEGSDDETAQTIITILKEINRRLKVKEDVEKTKDPRRAVISSIIFDISNSN